MQIVTLLTDFGIEDTFIGVMKGVIYSIAPQVHIVDLTHAIRPQQVVQGSLALTEAVPYFPAGTVHVAVVDPGVGTERRALAAEIGGQYFVGPDNGLFTAVADLARQAGQPVRFYALDKPEFWLAKVSKSFHGRDIFAPVGAHLAAGKTLAQVGTLIDDPRRVEIPQPHQEGGQVIGQVMVVDHFGNLLTNLKPQHLSAGGRVLISVAEAQIEGVVTTFGERQPGELIAMIDSSGVLQISVVNGNAAARLHADAGTAVKVQFG
jgi:S-adenosylmethionine hydrolase